MLRGTIDGTSLRTLKNFLFLKHVFNGQSPEGFIYLKEALPEVQDPIVQEVLRIILDAIFDPQFIDQSHGAASGAAI